MSDQRAVGPVLTTEARVDPGRHRARRRPPRRKLLDALDWTDLAPSPDRRAAAADDVDAVTVAIWPQARRNLES
jgi:hypothetical protein